MIESQADNQFFPLTHLAVLEVSGEDAGQFLQGQLTCNINDLSATMASFAAYCNAKGRVISTLLLIKQETGFQIILPASLLNSVQSKLQRYILRSKVKLQDCSQNIKLFGLIGPHTANFTAAGPALSVTNNAFPCINLPASPARALCLLDDESLENSITGFHLQGFHQGDDAWWRYLDICAGIPWFELAHTELYIPQMLNIDQLGGISFSKGCYTGQEIVARTHYLGQNKRELFIAEAVALPSALSQQTHVLDAGTSTKVGNVLAQQSCHDKSRLLLVLQTVEAQTKNLILDDADRTELKLLTCQ